MKKSEAEQAIIRLWDRWIKKNKIADPEGTDAYRFYNELETQGHPVLGFHCKGDKWQVVNGWLIKRDKVNP